MKHTRNKKRGGTCCKYETRNTAKGTCLHSTATEGSKNAKQDTIRIPFEEFNGFTKLKFKVRNHALKHADQYKDHERRCFDTIQEEQEFMKLLSNVVKDYLLVPDGVRLNDIGEQKIIEQQAKPKSQIDFHVPYVGGNLLCRSYLEPTSQGRGILFIEIYGIKPNEDYNTDEIYPAAALPAAPLPAAALPAAALPAAALPAAAAADEDASRYAGLEKMVDDITREPDQLDTYFEGAGVSPETIALLKHEEFDVDAIKLLTEEYLQEMNIPQEDIDIILDINRRNSGGSRKRKRKRRRTLKKRMK